MRITVEHLSRDVVEDDLKERSGRVEISFQEEAVIAGLCEKELKGNLLKTNEARCWRKPGMDTDNSRSHALPGNFKGIWP